MISLFEKAVEHWHQFTCLKFEPFNPNKHGQHRSRLYVENSNMLVHYLLKINFLNL